MTVGTRTPLCPPNAPLVGYTFVRHVGFILDELSSQGLDLWRDERERTAEWEASRMLTVVQPATW